MMALAYREILSSLNEHTCNDPFLVFEKQHIFGCVAVADIVNSTSITAKLSPQQAGMYYTVFINTLANIAQTSGAKVVKNIGDSILFYFPQHSSQNPAETTLFCTQKMITEIPSINQRLKRMQLPNLKFRLSTDYGKMIVGRCKVSACEDIFGSTVNLCAKMNRYARPNSIIIGNDLYQLAKKLKHYDMNTAGHISTGLIQKYPLYSVEEKLL